MNEIGFEERLRRGQRDFSEMDFSLYDWRELIFVDADFSRANLTGIMIHDANIEGASFYDADLQEAVFFNCNLRGVNFDESVLRRTNFSDCNLDEATFRYTDIRFAHFSYSSLKRTIWTSDLIEGENSFIESDFTGCQHTPDICDFGVRIILPNGEIYTTPCLEGNF